MKQAVKNLLLLVIVLTFGANIFAQNDLVEIFDATKDYPDSQEPEFGDRAFFDNRERNIKTYLKKYLPAACRISLSLETVLEGSFTKPNSAQKAYVYEGKCEPSARHQEATGIMIVENGKVVSNRFYSAGNFQGVKILPDINRNNLSELAFISTFYPGSVRDYDRTWLDIVEYKAGKTFHYLGTATTQWWSGLARKPEDKFGKYKIFVKPSTNPKFFHETYRQDKNEKWIVVKELEEFALTKEEKK